MDLNPLSCSLLQQAPALSVEGPGERHFPSVFQHITGLIILVHSSQQLVPITCSPLSEPVAPASAQWPPRHGSANRDTIHPRPYISQQMNNLLTMESVDLLVLSSCRTYAFFSNGLLWRAVTPMPHSYRRGLLYLLVPAASGNWQCPEASSFLQYWLQYLCRKSWGSTFPYGLLSQYPRRQDSNKS